MKVLLIDDDPDVAETVTMCFNLSWPEAKVVVAYDGRSGIEMLEKEKPDVVILDLGLPDMDGMDVCRHIRRVSDVPVLMLTARGQDVDKVKGLEGGADDYITKPYSYVELLARVRAVLRRSQAALPISDEPPYVAGGLSVDFAAREVSWRGQPVKLTPIEYRLLYHLVKNRGRVLPHRTLLAKVWGREYVDDTDYLKVHIQHLRQKLEEDPQKPRMVLTERGVGYKFVEPEA
ncbi:MAG: response regulator transcription factor [Chloroflexota bacterium]